MDKNIRASADSINQAKTVASKMLAALKNISFLNLPSKYLEGYDHSINFNSESIVTSTNFAFVILFPYFIVLSFSGGGIIWADVTSPP